MTDRSKRTFPSTARPHCHMRRTLAGTSSKPGIRTAKATIRTPTTRRHPATTSRPSTTTSTAMALPSPMRRISPVFPEATPTSPRTTSMGTNGSRPGRRSDWRGKVKDPQLMIPPPHRVCLFPLVKEIGLIGSTRRDWRLSPCWQRLVCAPSWTSPRQGMNQLRSSIILVHGTKFIYRLFAHVHVASISS